MPNERYNAELAAYPFQEREKGVWLVKTKTLPVSSIFLWFAPAVALLTTATLAPAPPAVGNPPATPAPVAKTSKSAAPAPVSFTNDLLPVFTKLSCNSGPCHGQQNGKGGFRLSLRGWDPVFDQEQITKDAGGRRVSLKDATASLLLRKPTGMLPHGGGKLITPYSPEYQLLLRWINEGAKGPDEKEAKLTDVSLTPTGLDLPRAGEKRTIQVTATYSDKSTRNVTALARYQSQNDAVAQVDEGGQITTKGPGECAVLVSYGGIVRTVSVLVPFAKAELKPTTKPDDLDNIVERKLARLGLTPSATCTDSEFVRRVYLDTLALLPTPAETRAFLADKDPNKRAKLIDVLLERPEYVDYRTLKIADLLRVNGQYLSDEGADTYYRWIREQVATNVPYDRFVRELLTGRGSTFRTGPANFYRVAQNPEELAESTSQVFLGTRIACAKCHNHPFENWKQSDYYGVAAFFARYARKYGPEFAEEQVIVRRDGEVQHPRTKAVVRPRYLGGSEVTGEPDGDRRLTLAKWLASSDNRQFARVAVNRLWADFFGRGIVDPVDDFRISNPPANAELLETLATAFIQSGLDIKAMTKRILNSRTYQRSSQILPGNIKDDRYFARAYPRRLPSEALLDSIGQVTLKQDRYWPYPDGWRAAQIRDSRVGHYFLEVFGRPKREIVCACERSQQPNLAQSLHLMNSGAINGKLSAGDGRVAQLIKTYEKWAPEARDRKILEELYYLTLCRPPSNKELSAIYAYVQKQKDRKQGYEDALWALLNSEEFLFQK